MIAAAAISFTIGSTMVQLIVNEYGTLSNRWAYQGIFLAQYGVGLIAAIFLPFMPEYESPDPNERENADISSQVTLLSHFA